MCHMPPKRYRVTAVASDTFRAAGSMATMTLSVKLEIRRRRVVAHLVVEARVMWVGRAIC